jgi:trk system potassium uptake protein TrkH
MNFRLIANTTSYVLWVEAGFLLLPLAASVLYGEAWLPFFGTAVLCILLGTALHLVPVKKAQMHSRDGFMAVALGWIVLSLTGALPYAFTGALTHYVDAVFETVSGLTTTGSTVFPEVEHLPRSVLLWRSLTQWMGGMGVLVLFLALMPKLGDGAVYLMRAESPGPIKSKLVPKVGSTAKILYAIYVALTVLEMVCLRLAGATWFSAVNHAFTTMATGGFSIYNTSLSGASPAVMWIVTAFSFLAGVNFSLPFLAVTGRLRAALRSEELRVYLSIVVGVTLLICLCLRVQAGVPLGESVTDAAFQTVTIITTTGFATVDFALWPTFCRMALLVLMFTGGCAGSTSGGIKLSRVLILWKSLVRELKRMVHPNHVSVIKVDGQPVEERVVSSTGAYIMAYMAVLLAGALVVSWDNFGFQESFAASLTCISNVGPGLGILGPMENFSILSPLSKIALSLEMLTGRLELMPMLALLTRGAWRDR